MTGRRLRCMGRGPGKARGSRALLAPHPGTGVSLATSLRVLGTRPLATCDESSPGPSFLPSVDQRGPTPLWSLGAAWWSTPGVLWPCGAPHGRPRSAASGVVGRSCLGVAEEAALPFADCLALFQEQQRPSVRPECFLLVRLPRAWACGPGAEEEERNVHSRDHDPPAPRCILRRDRTRSHWCVAPRGSGAKRSPPRPAARLW